jgi:hypothetical protein
MSDDLTFAPTHSDADYCDADETNETTPVSEAEILAWEANPWF